MEKFLINKYLEKFNLKLNKLFYTLRLEEKINEINSTENELKSDTFWLNTLTAKTKVSNLNNLKETVNKYNSLKSKYDSILEFLDNEDFLDLIEAEIIETDNLIKQLEEEALLTSEFDECNAYLAIHPGAGGTDSQDFASILLRMYERYFELKNFKAKIIDYLPGEEAGLKSVLLHVTGKHAFGLLKAEMGVHRLVRNSPFDASNRRHTSFASIDVTPELEDENFKINENDLKIDVYHSSGAGGQSVNTTDSAVRITHLPTGIVVTSQQERSQIKNRENALKVLKSKLLEIEHHNKMKKLDDIKGIKSNINFGSQIRSYVFSPYTLVKDHRTNYEETNVKNVLDGYIDNFIYEYLNYIKE